MNFKFSEKTGNNSDSDGGHRGHAKRWQSTLASVFIMASLIASANLAILTAAYPAFIAMAQVQEPSYVFDYRWGSTGAGNGQFSVPRGGDFDTEGNFYVVDRNNHRIQKFTEDGTFLKAWGGLCDAIANPGACDGRFRFPLRLAIDAGNNVYVTDQINERVQVFDSEGTFIRKINMRTLQATGTVFQPHGIEVDSLGNIYVSFNTFVKKVNNAGTSVLDSVTISGGIGDLGLDNQGNLFGVTQGGTTLYKLDSSSLDVVKSVPKADVNSKQPIALGVDSDGNVFVVDDVNGTTDPTPDRVIKLTNNLEYVTKFADIGDSSATSTRILAPGDVALNTNGKAFVSDFNQIKVYSPVQVNNQPPVANAGADQTVNEGAMVNLDGSASADLDGAIASYLWEQTAGTSLTLSNSSAASPTFTAPSVSTQTLLTFNLTVTDNDSGTASDTVEITVNNVNQVPIADAGTDQTVNEGNNVALDGTASSDSDGTIQSYSWLQTAGTLVTLDDSSSAAPSFTAPSVGSAGETLTFELTATDNNGDTDTDTVDINVLNVNSLPPAIAGEDFSVNEGTNGVQLDGSGSTDSDGTISSYLWQQTGGPAVTLNDANTATATFDAPQVSANTPLTFKLTVTDNDGGTDDDTVVATVNDVENILLEIEGFYSPVDMNNIINTIKSTKSVPLKFEIFEVVRAANGNEISRTEITDTSTIQSFTHEQIPCSNIESTGTDAVEITNSLGTIEPRYDADSGQFKGNWKASGPSGICYAVEVTTVDDSSTAYFKTK